MTMNLGTATHKARKRHVCDSCMREILPGTIYYRSRMVDGGDAWVWKSHPACTKAGNILWDAGITGDEDCLINVSDMDADDRQMIYNTDPKTFWSVWPNRSAPSKPTLVTAY